jgi:hypothetical protein
MMIEGLCDRAQGTSCFLFSATISSSLFSLTESFELYPEGNCEAEKRDSQMGFIVVTKWTYMET